MTAEHARRLDAPPETLDDDPLVGDMMTGHVVAITADARLPVALRVMTAKRVRHLPVIRSGRCVGMLLESELARLMLGPATSHEVPPLTVGEVCRAAPCLAPTDRRSVAARAMQDAGVDAALVLDEGRLLGIVTGTDLLCSLVR